MELLNSLSTKLYHNEVGIPPAVLRQIPNRVIKVRYSRHAIDQAQQKYGLFEKDLPSHFNPSKYTFEVEVLNGKLVKYVVRMYLDQFNDICIPITMDGIAKTVWLNHSNDNHFTLDKGRYAVA